MGLVGLRVVDQPMVDGVESEFEAVGDAELVKNVVKVVLHGLLGDEQFFADLLVAEALGHKLNNLFLAAGAGIRGLGKSLHDLGSHAVIEPDFAGKNAMNAFDQQIGGGLLEDHAARAEPHGADYVTIVFRGSENDDARGNRVEIDFLEHREPVLVRHAKVEQQNVRLELGDKLDGFGAVLGLADNGDVFVAVKELAQTIAEYGVIIRHQDSNLLFRRLSHTRSSSRSVFRRSDAPHAPGSTPPSEPHLRFAFAP